MIRVLLHDGESITLNANPADVGMESGVLTVKRDSQVIASFRRHIGWHEVTEHDG